MRHTMRYGATRAACLWVIGLWAGTTSGQATLPGDLPEIVKRLGSDEFVVRDAAQKELAKMPSARVALLREADRNAVDEEVKARLETRIAEMELDMLLHPGPLTIDLENASLEDVAAALNARLGGTYVQAGILPHGGAAAAKGITLHLKDQPFWEIIRQVNEIVPVSITSVTTMVGFSARGTVIRLAPLPAGAPPCPMTVIDGAMIIPQTSGTPATANWSLRSTLYLDPRVRINRYTSTLHVDKALDQDGRPLSTIALAGAATTVYSRPVSTLDVTASFAPARGLSAVKELHGTCKAEVLAVGEKYKIDLTADAIPPLETMLGRITVDRAANGNYTLQIVPPAEPPASTGPNVPVSAYFTVRDKAGDVVQSISASGPQLSVPIARGAGDRAAATVEFDEPTKTREAVFVVQLKDLPIPPTPATPTAVALPAVRGVR